MFLLMLDHILQISSPIHQITQSGWDYHENGI